MQGFIEGQQNTELIKHTVTLDHTHLTTDQILRKLLPSNIEVPSSFETIGHIAHLNLRDEQLPYKKIIADVILEVCAFNTWQGLIIFVRKTQESKQW